MVHQLGRSNSVKSRKSRNVTKGARDVNVQRNNQFCGQVIVLEERGSIYSKNRVRAPRPTPDSYAVCTGYKEAEA